MSELITLLLMDLWLTLTRRNRWKADPDSSLGEDETTFSGLRPHDEEEGKKK